MGRLQCNTPARCAPTYRPLSVRAPRLAQAPAAGCNRPLSCDSARARSHTHTHTSPRVLSAPASTRTLSRTHTRGAHDRIGARRRQRQTAPAAPPRRPCTLLGIRTHFLGRGRGRAAFSEGGREERSGGSDRGNLGLAEERLLGRLLGRLGEAGGLLGLNLGARSLLRLEEIELHLLVHGLLLLHRLHLHVGLQLLLAAERLELHL